jgi:hypothetical protein
MIAVFIGRQGRGLESQEHAPAANPIATTAPVRSRAVYRSVGEQKGESVRRLLIAVVFVAALTLCSVAVAAANLAGTWKETIHSAALHGALNGTWTFKANNGTYHVADNGQPIVHGNYTIKGSKISLKDAGGTGKCPGTGVYRFKVSGKSLKFTLVSDKAAACIGRRTVLTAGTFKQTS